MSAEAAVRAEAPPAGGAAIAIEDIRESKSNPRRRMDDQALAELTDSVRRVGVLQPILVRPVDLGRAGAGYEIVAGHRRFRAARAAGLPVIPAVVRWLADVEVLEIQITENLQRQDLDPLDEAEGLALLHRKYGHSVEDLALKIGKSKSAIYASLKLADLPAGAKKLLGAGKLTPSTALLVARIPDAKLAEQAAKEISSRRFGSGAGDPMSFREAAEHVQKTYMLRLSEAPFPVDAPKLAGKGICNTCPHRTGNQRELFGDIKSADVCTNPPCFRAKTDAWWQRRSAEYETTGGKVMPAGEAKQVFSRYGGLAGGKYVELDGQDYRSGQKWRQIVKGHDVEVVLARNPHDGTIHELVPAAQAMKALPKERRAVGSSGAASAAKQLREAKIRAAAARAVLEALVDKAVGHQRAMTPEAWRALAYAAVARAWHDPLKAVVSRRGLEEKGKGPQDLANAAIAKASGNEARGWVLEVLAAPALAAGHYFFRSGEKARVNALFEAFGVNRAAIERRVGAEAASRQPKKKAAKKTCPARAKEGARRCERPRRKG